jgi:glycosyltransferase involved in cell wall biosynthesis
MPVLSLTTFVKYGDDRRLGYAQESIATFLQTEWPKDTLVLVADDASTDPRVDAVLSKLEDVSNPSMMVYRYDVNVGCDHNMIRNMHKAFSLASEDYIVTCDSDVIYTPIWLKRLVDAREELQSKRPGMVSVFNTLSHPGIETEGEYVRKLSLGGFCATVERDLFYDPQMATETWDWKYVDVCRKHNRPFYSTEKSYVQHMGAGKSAHGLSWDTGIYFVGK